MVAAEGVGRGSWVGGSERHVNSETAARPKGRMTCNNFNSFRRYISVQLERLHFSPSEGGGAVRSAALFSSTVGPIIATHD